MPGAKCHFKFIFINVPLLICHLYKCIFHSGRKDVNLTLSLMATTGQFSIEKGLTTFSVQTSQMDLNLILLRL